MSASDLNLIEIEDFADPRLKPYANQTDAWLRARHNPDRVSGPDALTGRFMAEGTLVVEQLLESDYEVESILVASDRVESLRDLLAAAEPVTPIYAVEPRAMDTLVGFKIHRGLLACGKRGPPTNPDRLIRDASLLVVMEDLANHDNVGGIFRSLAGLIGPSAGVLLNDRTCDPLYRKAIRVSMGHVLHIPFAETDSWHTRGMASLREAERPMIALTPASDAIDLRDLDPARIERPAILVGAEGPGLRAATIEKADLRVRIPMRVGVDSLNVTVATSIVLYHFAEQTPKKGV